jgi:hypothetical protein
MKAHNRNCQESTLFLVEALKSGDYPFVHVHKVQHLIVDVENRQNIKVEANRVYCLSPNFKATYFLHYWRKENCSITGGEVGKMIHNHSLTLNVGSVTSFTTVQQSLP